VLKYNADGTLQRWEYSDSIARTELCRLIARDDLPLWHGSTPAFQCYINRSHNHRFVHVSKQTTARDMVKFYNKRMVNLIGTFKNDVGSVCLTYDIWVGKVKEDYLSVVAHFFNSSGRRELHEPIQNKPFGGLLLASTRTAKKPVSDQLGSDEHASMDIGNQSAGRC
jgi:hypothetical protein